MSTARAVEAQGTTFNSPELSDVAIRFLARPAVGA
jgi:hypothetical protein